MRSNESRSLLEVAEIMVQAAMFGKESRNKPYHHRLDYPETDNENWCGQVLIRKAGDGVEIQFLPLTFEDRGDKNAAGI